MGEKGLKKALIEAHEALPEGYHIEVVPDKNGVPRPIGSPDQDEVGPDGKLLKGPDGKLVKPRLIWNEKEGAWDPV